MFPAALDGDGAVALCPPATSPSRSRAAQRSIGIALRTKQRAANGSVINDDLFVLQPYDVGMCACVFGLSDDHK